MNGKESKRKIAVLSLSASLGALLVLTLAIAFVVPFGCNPMALISVPVPEEALLLRDRETYVIVVVRGNVKVFSAAGVYHVAKSNAIIETVIVFDELKGKALNERYPLIKEFFEVAVDVSKKNAEMHSDELTVEPEYSIVSLGWHPPVGNYSSPLSREQGSKATENETIATITHQNRTPTCRDVQNLAANWLSSFGLRPRNKME